MGVKLNSADFQRGGFTEEESLAVIEALATDGIDCVEVSGGTYESAAMMGAGQSERTRAREAYFIEFARKARERVKVALVVTGGFRTIEGMEQALSDGATDFIGLARPLASEPDLCARLLRGQARASSVTQVKTGIAFVDKRALPEISYYEAQIRRIAEGAPLLESPSGPRALWEMAIYAIKSAGRRNRA